MTIDEQLQEQETPTTKKTNWIGNAFKENKATMGFHLVGAALATGAATGVSYVMDKGGSSDAAIATVATIVDATSYWGTFFGFLARKEKDQFKDENGNFSWNNTKKKLAQYGTMFGTVEAFYSVLRGGSQYLMQKNGWDPASASLVIQLSATAFFTGAWPIIQYGAKDAVEVGSKAVSKVKSYISSSKPN